MLFFFILFVRYSGLTSSLLIQFVSRFSIFCLHISIQQWSWFTRLQGEIDSSRGLLCVDKGDTSFCRVLKSHLTLHLPHVTHHVTTLIRWQTKRNIYTTPLPFQKESFFSYFGYTTSWKYGKPVEGWEVAFATASPVKNTLKENGALHVWRCTWWAGLWLPSFRASYAVGRSCA